MMNDPMNDTKPTYPGEDGSLIDQAEHHAPPVEEPVVKQGVGDQLLWMLDAAKETAEFIACPAKPQPGDIVLIQKASMPYYWTGRIVSVTPDGNWYDLEYSHPLGGRETVVQRRATNAGVHDVHRGLTWNDEWKVRGLYRQ